LRRLEPGRDDKEITEALAEYWGYASDEGTLWRFDVAHNIDCDDPSLRAWEKGDRHAAAQFLLASFGLEHDSDFREEPWEDRVVYLDELQNFAKAGGITDRVILARPEDRSNPTSALNWRHELLWPLIYMPPEKVWQVTRQTCRAAGLVVVPGFDVNLFGDHLMISRYARDQMAERVFYDPGDPQDQGAIWAAQCFRSSVRQLIQDGGGLETQPISSVDEILDTADTTLQH
jgi:hypothetical protein